MNQRILLAGLALVLSGVLAFVFFNQAPQGPTALTDGSTALATGANAAGSSDLADGSRELAFVDPSDGPAAPRREAVGAGATAKAKPVVEIPTGPVLKGRIIDDRGRGVPDAVVEMRVPLRDQGLVGLLVEDALTRQETKTNGLGYYELIGLPGKSVEFDVGADGYAKLEAKSVDLPTDFTRPIEDLELRLGLILQGSVVDLTGRAIEGAELYSVDPNGPDFAFRVMTHKEPDAVSDAEGRFELKRIAVGKWAIEVRATDRPLRTFRGETAEPGRNAHALWFEIPDGGVIKGSVTGLDAARFAGFRVEAVPTEGMPYFGGRSLERPRSEIDGDGHFEIRGLDRELEYKVKLAPSQNTLIAFAGQTGTRSDEVIVRPLDVDVELAYRPGTRVTFQVLDATDRKPVENFVAKFGQPMSARTLTKANGEVQTEHRDGFGSFEDVYSSDAVAWQDGGWHLEVLAPGFENWSRDAIEITDGVDLEIGEILLMPAGNLRIVVKDAVDGDPINSAMIRLTKLEGEGDKERARWGGMDVLTPPVKKTKTGPDGRATIDGFGSEPAELVVSRTRYADYVQRIVMGGEDMTIEVLLSAEATVETLARDVNGNELGEVDIQHRAPGDDDVTSTIKASNRGRARFRGLIPGEHLFRIAPRDGVQAADWQTVALAPGADTTVVLLGPARGTLKGRVLEGGQPVADAEVSVLRIDGNDGQRFERQGRRGGRMVTGRSATTDSQGRFEVDDLEYSDYAVVVEMTDRAMSERVEVTLDRATVEVAVNLSICGVQGTVVDTDGHPIVGAQVRAIVEGEDDNANNPFRNFRDWNDPSVVEVATAAPNTIGPRTNAAGTFALKGLRAGTPIILEATFASAKTTRTAPFVLSADELRDDMKIVMEPAGSIVVRVDGAKEGMTFYRITATLLDGSERQDNFVMGSNATTLSALTPGEWTIEMYAARNGDAAPLDSRKVDVQVGKSTEVVFTAPAD